MKNIIKIIIIYISRILLRVFYIFPLKRNRILFSSFNGENYNCNPKYIFEYLYSHYGNIYECIWCLNDKAKLPDKYEAVCVDFFSLSYFYYLFTSKIIISNLEVEATMPKMKKQLLINTWHGGGAYKICSNDLGKKSKSRWLFMRYTREIRANTTNFVISSCKNQVGIYKKDFNIDADKSLNIGMPRNDIFFRVTPDEVQNIKQKICNQYLINPRKKLVLYAPTQRRNASGVLINNEFKIDVEKVCNAVEERFGGEAVMLYRYHTGVSGIVLNQAVDVSNYQDMQELLLTVDILITDYSSSIWDYSFTNKPGFLFTPDLEKYKAETNFHTPIELWPFPYAKATEALCKEILNYNEIEAIEKIRMHHSLLGSYEKGNATAKICNIIQDFIYK